MEIKTFDGIAHNQPELDEAIPRLVKLMRVKLGEAMTRHDQDAWLKHSLEKIMSMLDAEVLEFKEHLPCVNNTKEAKREIADIVNFALMLFRRIERMEESKGASK